MPNTLVYDLEGKTYINLTNRCTNDCIFCLRNDKDDVCGANLWLENENFTAADVINQLSTIYHQLSTEIIFCGYGEPTLKLDILKEVAAHIKKNLPDAKVRLNTNGHANVVHKRNIVPELVGLVDEISISLNAPTENQYIYLSQPKIENAYAAVLDFIECCAHNKIKTTASVVEGYKGLTLDIAACKKVANDHGADLRVREWIPNGY